MKMRIKIDEGDPSLIQENGFFYHLKFLLILSFFIIILLFVYLRFYLILPPNDFPKLKVFEIKKGESLKEIGERLEKEKIIQSSLAFDFLVYWNKDLNIKAGKYTFNKPLNIFEVFEKFKKGDGDLSKTQIALTIKPGEPNYVIARRFARKMKNIEEDDFLIESKPYEGELATETLYFNFDAKTQEVVKRFHQEFLKLLKKSKIILPKDEKERRKIIIIASLIEAEAGKGSYEDKRHVAGVIYNRLKRGMPLQLDATFLYIKKVFPGERRVIYKKDFNLESKYNTYKYKGLPPSPICNFSMASLKAALNPMKTSDLYYITGKDGKFYYSKTGSGHIKNVNKYLRD